MNIKSHKTHKQTGQALIEILVAITISMFLMIGIVTLFTNNKRVYNEQDELARIQENGRFAMELLIKDIRMAGYLGCHNKPANVFNHLAGVNTDEPFDFTNAVEGFEQGTATWQPSGSTDQITTTPPPLIALVANTDAITIRYLSPTGFKLRPPILVSASDIQIYTAPNDRFSAGDIIAISDCNTTDIEQLSATSSGGLLGSRTTTGERPGNASSFMQIGTRNYEASAEIARFVGRRYFIGNGAKGPALFMKENANVAVELIEGVDNMQILYGVDTNDDGVANSFVEADDAVITDWNNVVSVRIAILVRSPDENFSRPPDNNTYTLLGTGIPAAGDQRRRRVFNADIVIRNRVER